METSMEVKVTSMGVEYMFSPIEIRLLSSGKLAWKKNYFYQYSFLQSMIPPILDPIWSSGPSHNVKNEICLQTEAHQPP